MKNLFRLLFSFIIGIYSNTTFSSEENKCTTNLSNCEEVGKWEFSLALGMGERTNPLADTRDIPLYLIPQISYSGKHFFLQNLDAGFIFSEGEQHRISGLITPSYDTIFFYRHHPKNYFIDAAGFTLDSKSIESNASQAGAISFTQSDSNGNKITLAPVSWRKLHKRQTAGLAGIEVFTSFDSFDLQFQLLQDITNIHDGKEARLSIAKHWNNGNHWLNLSVGANWQSASVINYYYGVGVQEADAKNVYSAASDISTMMRFDWKYKLTRHWDLQFLASYRHLPHEIRHSPIVTENKVITTFVGGVYHF